MANVLSFTLGLEASKFISQMGIASHSVIEFLAVGELVRKGFEKTWSAIERGGQLNDLSARTKETVSNLYSMEEAFKVVGIGADKVGGMTLKLQKAMSGVSDTGEATAGLFGAMGLNLEQLKKADGVTQITRIGEALGKLDKNSAAGIAGKIFGREGAGDILQISRDMESFTETVKDSQKEAALFARNAAAFDKIGDTLVRIKSKTEGFFAGIAAGAAPSIQAVEDAINKIDFTGFGEQLGVMLHGFINAFKSDNAWKLIADTISFGFEAAVDLAPGIFAKLGIVLLEVFKTPIAYLQAGIEYAIDQAVNNPVIRKFLSYTTMGASETAFKGLGLGEGGDAESFQSILNKRLAIGPEYFTQGNTTGAMNAEVTAELKRRFEDVKKNWGDLFGEFKSFAVDGKAIGVAGGGTPSQLDLTKITKPDVSALEKIGFVIGTGVGGNDHARETARNTATTVNLLRDLPDKIANAIPRDKLTNQPA
jgi:hypothetical protein